MSEGEIFVSRGAADAVVRGAPWVYQDQLVRPPRGLETGAWVAIVHDGKTIGRGLFDESSPIAARVWTHGEPVNAALVHQRASRAASMRRALFDERTNAYRVVHGEGDRLPGVVVDRYADVAVLRLDGPAIATRVDDVVAAVWPAVRGEARSLLLRNAARGGAGKTTVLEGPEVRGEVLVKELGVPFVVDVLHGQKTGAFLDQRDNRARVGAMAAGKRVLNLFSYAGGFSLHAALGGATKVTSVDVASAAHATAQASFRAAGVDPSKHAFVTADVYAFLEGAQKRGEAWDLVISDPPSFAPSEKAVPKALAAYRKLHHACVRVLAEGGVFCASSCSSHVGATRFLSTLDDASLGRGDLSLAALFGHPEDHPTLPAWPEGAYLKFAVLR